jgi:hypothetical protein
VAMRGATVAAAALGGRSCAPAAEFGTPKVAAACGVDDGDGGRRRLRRPWLALVSVMATGSESEVGFIGGTTAGATSIGHGYRRAQG